VTKRLLCTLFFLMLAVPAYAATIVAIVSPQNAPDVISGAHNFLQQNANITIQIRTTEQWLDLDPTQQQQLLQSAKLVFAGGVFGNGATLLSSSLRQSRVENFVAVHSDRQLVTASQIRDEQLLVNADIEALMQNPDPDQDADKWLESRLDKFPQQHDWLLTRLFWLGRSGANMQGLFSHLNHLLNGSETQGRPRLVAPIRAYYRDKFYRLEQFDFTQKSSWVVLLDYEMGDRPGEKKLLDELCDLLEQESTGCLSVLAGWGSASVVAIQTLVNQNSRIRALISLQNFVVGGGEGRERVTEQFEALNVPVIKAIRLSGDTEEDWLLSEEGLSWDSVHYRVAMPELQGVSQPIVVAALGDSSVDYLTGAKLALSQTIPSQVKLLGQRINRWLALQTKANKDKKLALVYYNHPPGRHNIGADNLNVSESLFEILTALQAEGYDTGTLPANSNELLDLLQLNGVNLPEDGIALADMATRVQVVNKHQYQQWFATLPKTLQQEMVHGPLGYLHNTLQRTVQLEDKTISQRLMTRVIKNLYHALDGADHPARERVLKLLDQLDAVYANDDVNQIDWHHAADLVDAITTQGVEGIRGWGEAPGYVMVHGDKIVLPGIQFGNIFVGPQPPRGWELNEELLHANLSFPPPHQYMAFYQWLNKEFDADAVIHLGRHSTYEFLPRHRVGMSEEDYPSAILGDLPSIYPYIVDGVGEGIQAKRRGLAVIVDHLTPPLDSTELYDSLLELRQLVESYEAAPFNAEAIRHRAISDIKHIIDTLNLKEELIASMSDELEVRGITEFDQIDDELLVHEVGHYLTILQEDFMPLGLHVFGRNWSGDAVATMLRSMSQNKPVGSDWEQLLSASPKAEIQALLTALDSQYVLAGKGNDPIRTPEALPTGRNFYALNGSLIPSRLGYQIGIELAAKARAATVMDAHQVEDSEADAIVLWASDVVRDEGAMIAFGFDMLGVKPIWNSRGIFQGLERLDLTNLKDIGPQGKKTPRLRRDTLFTTSGLFRDLYGAQLIWLEHAVLMALNASSDLIREQYPALTYALNSALAPLDDIAQPGREPLDINRVAARWVKDARAALHAGIKPEQAGREASYRVFGAPPGSYGAGVNRMVERSGSWQDRNQIAKTYIYRMGHTYGTSLPGDAAQDLFRQRLDTVANTYLGRASNLYGLLDNNDSFDYLGGLSLAVETITGQVPNNFILSHADSQNLKIEPLQTALLTELRGRFLNPQWLKPLINEGYAGARTMGSEFLEYLWGWQVTNPGVVKSWVWDEVKQVYLDDKFNLGLDQFLQQGHNVHIKTNMLALMLVAAQKDFWDADQHTLEQIAEQFSALVLAHGLPGSGHTTQDHPIYEWLQGYTTADQYTQLQALLQATKVTPAVVDTPTIISEITLADDMTESPTATQSEHDIEKNAPSPNHTLIYALSATIILLLIIGWLRGAKSPATSIASKRD
jgi:cobaltochelatase CobN